MKTLPLLKGNTVRLRAPEPTDIDLLYEWENDTAIWRISGTYVPFSRYQIQSYVLQSQHDFFTEKQLRLMIDGLNQSDPYSTIGAIDLFDFDPVHLRAGVGILIQEEFRKKGYASEALSLLIRYSFSILGLHQLYTNITPNNKASIRLFEKNGFIKCGIKKHWLNEGGKWLDELMFQLLIPTDYQ